MTVIHLHDNEEKHETDKGCRVGEGFSGIQKI